MLMPKMFRILVAFSLVLALVGCTTTTSPPESNALIHDTALPLPEESNALKEDLKAINVQEQSSSLGVSPSFDQSTQQIILEQAVPTSVPPSSIAENKSETVSKVSVTSIAQPLASSNKQNVGTVFEGYAVSVTNKTTPAAYSGSTDWPITTYYFFDAQDNRLGSISVKAYTDIMQKYGRKNQTTGEWMPPSGNDWVVWFANAYNEYRGIKNVVLPDTTSAGSDEPSNEDFDAGSLAADAFALVNQERVDAGLDEVEMDSEMMDLAALRATELEELYEHIQPDGGRISLDYGYAEINNRRASTASKAVSSWMGSSGHKDIILTGKYTSAGIGCYMGSDGTVYWCMLFSK